MGAPEKNLIPQLVPQQASTRLFVPDPETPQRTMGLEEAQRVSQYVPVLVLMPATGAAGASFPGQATRKSSTRENSATALLLQFLENAMPKLKVKKSEDFLAFADVKVNFASMEATRKGQPVPLTPLEFKTLKYMAENVRRVIPRQELLNEVWGYENYPCTRTVDNLILKLRQKLEKEPSRPVHFQTVHRAGYKFLP